MNVQSGQSNNEDENKAAFKWISDRPGDKDSEKVKVYLPIEISDDLLFDIIRETKAALAQFGEEQGAQVRPKPLEILNRDYKYLRHRD